MRYIAILLGLFIIIGTHFLDAPILSKVTTIQEQTAFLSKIITIYFGNILIWIGVLAPKDN